MRFVCIREQISLSPAVTVCFLQATLVECQLSSHVVVRVRLSLHLLGGLGGRTGGIPLILRQMVAGLSKEEWEELGLEGVAREELGLQVILEERSETGALLPRQFSAWRSSLAQLGIPFSDLVRVFASVLLLQNLNEEDILERNKQGLLRRLSHLLGVQHKSLLACLTNPTQPRSKQQTINSRNWRQTSNCLATSLYQRTLLTVVRRINCPGTGTSPPSTGLSVSLLDSPSIIERGNSSGLHLLASNLLSETIQVVDRYFETKILK